MEQIRSDVHLPGAIWRMVNPMLTTQTNDFGTILFSVPPAHHIHCDVCGIQFLGNETEIFVRMLFCLRQWAAYVWLCVVPCVCESTKNKLVSAPIICLATCTGQSICIGVRWPWIRKSEHYFVFFSFVSRVGPTNGGRFPSHLAVESRTKWSTSMVTVWP